MTIYLREIWKIEDQKEYKIHFARWNQHNQPLEIFARNREDWQNWQEYRPGRDEFNRPLIFSLMQYYHEQDSWLFGGIFKVLARHRDRYEVALTDIGANMVGRLKLSYTHRQRQTRANMERHFNSFIVKEILPEPYTGQAFPGFDNIDLSFIELETLMRNDRLDWRIALENIRGVYLITDTNDGRRYVGSAYGEYGIWGRWRQYVENGHGDNIELKAFVNEFGLEYCRKYFRVALLEQHSVSLADSAIIAREAFWKAVLLTRGDKGFNRN